MMIRMVCFCLLSLTSVSLLAQSQPDPLDWPYWRGPEMNGISREKGLPDTWSPEGENVIWKSAHRNAR